MWGVFEISSIGFSAAHAWWQRALTCLMTVLLAFLGLTSLFATNRGTVDAPTMGE
jgi:hypothetical protein